MLGLPIDILTFEQAQQHMLARFGAAPTAPELLHIVTLNPEYVMAARADREFADAIAAADLVVADGIGVALGLRIASGTDCERITGVDLAERILQSARARVFLLGSPDSIADLHGRYPRSVVGRWGNGTAAPSDDLETIERIAKRNANVVLVGYGAPGQVLWIERNRPALAAAGVRVAIGVGGALDTLAGRVPRAPKLVRRAGLEWAYRLVRQPWRWRRQLVLPRFVALILEDRVRR